MTGEEWQEWLSVCLDACLLTEFLQLLYSQVDFFYEMRMRCDLTALFFLFFYVSGSFEAGRFLQIAVCGFFKWPSPNQVLSTLIS